MRRDRVTVLTGAATLAALLLHLSSFVSPEVARAQSASPVVVMKPQQGAAVAPPTVSSTDYPDDGVWRDGVGRYGEFVIDDPDGEAVRYEIRLNDGPLMAMPRDRRVA